MGGVVRRYIDILMITIIRISLLHFTLFLAAAPTSLFIF